MNNNNDGLILSTIHHKKATKKNKQPKKKPIKVVYISNPMKVQATASEFRALVQELTGQYADFPDPSKFPATPTDSDASLHQKPPPSPSHDDDDNYHHDSVSVEVPVEPLDSGDHELFPAAVDSDNGLYDAFDDPFSSPMMGNFSGFLQSTVLYQSYAS